MKEILCTSISYQQPSFYNVYENFNESKKGSKNYTENAPVSLVCAPHLR